MGIASKLDRLVQFQRAALVPDGGGGSVMEWMDHGPVMPALRQDVKDTEKWAAGIFKAEISTRFHVRDSEFTRDIDATDRVICEGQTFNITGTKQVHPGRRQLIELSAVAYV